MNNVDNNATAKAHFKLSEEEKARRILDIKERLKIATPGQGKRKPKFAIVLPHSTRALIAFAIAITMVFSTALAWLLN
jgi:hypothetical protein